MSKATKNTAKAKASKTVAKGATKVAKVEISKAQANFNKSVEAIKTNRSTGNATLDALGAKVLHRIFDGKLTFTEDWDEGSFNGKLGEAEITVGKVAHGKNNRTVLNVAGVQIQGEFAARAYKMAHASLNKKGRKTIEVDEDQVNDVMSLLD
jgi:hypothetical protein